MVDAQVLSNIKELIQAANSILVIYPGKDQIEIRSSAEAVVSALQVAGKEVRLLTPREPVVIENYPENSDVVSSIEMGNKNLTISFDYSPEQVDKVSYHIGEETKKFYLTIKPQKNAQPLDQESVEFSYSGAEADLIITVGVAQLEELQQLYYGYEDLYQETPVISINNYDVDFARQSVVPVTAPSLSQETAKLLLDLDLSFPSEAATQLLYGIELKTDGLRSHLATAETFDVVANLLRYGARRLQISNKKTVVHETIVEDIDEETVEIGPSPEEEEWFAKAQQPMFEETPVDEKKKLNKNQNNRQHKNRRSGHQGSSHQSSGRQRKS